MFSVIGVVILVVAFCILVVTFLWVARLLGLGGSGVAGRRGKPGAGREGAAGEGLAGEGEAQGMRSPMQWRQRQRRPQGVLVDRRMTSRIQPRPPEIPPAACGQK